MTKGRYIAIEGNIGSGKTTLAKLLAPHFNARLLLEEFEENPFLKGFYKDPQRYGFSVEMSFLADRYHQLNEIQLQQDLFQPNIIADYAPFKSLLFAQNNLSEHEFKLYRDFWQMSLGKLPEPDLVVFLARPPAALKRNIKKRGRLYEQEISEDYLIKIGNRYEHYFKQQPQIKRLFIEAEHYDFLNVQKALIEIYESIELSLNHEV